MKLELSNFGGIIPGTDPQNLPANGAQEALNVDLSEGTIKPWGVTNAFRRLHYPDTLTMIPGFPATDIALITKGTKPTLASYSYLFQAAASISITAKVFITWDGGSDTLTSTLTINSIQMTPTGFKLNCTIDTGTIKALDKGVSYIVTGPCYQINFAEAVATGGTDAAYSFPSVLSSGSPAIPYFAVPLFTTANSRAKYQYGTLQLVDVQGPVVSGNYYRPTDPPFESMVTTYYAFFFGGNVDLHFDCNYLRNTPLRFYYLQQLVDEGGRDGPESDVSEEIVIQPGQIATLNTTASSKLFRSANTESGFALVRDSGAAASTYVEDLLNSLGAALAPNGNFPHASATAAVKGAIRHPAGYFVYFYGADLRPSSEWIDGPRPWAVPPEYAYTFDSDIECLALAGDTILVFTQDYAYKVHGQHPGRLAVYQISNKPILNKLTLWQDDVTVGWCNQEGLAVFNGSTGELLTGNYMRADRWNAFNPSGFKAAVNDRAVCLFHDTLGLRFDFRGDRTAAISNFTVTDGSTDAEWKSRVFVMPKPVSWYACRVNCTGETYISLVADGVEVVSDFPIPSQQDILLPRTVKAWRWEIKAQTGGEIREIILATNRREL